VIVRKAGNQTITATDTVTATITGQVTVTVFPAAATHFAVVPSTTKPVAGVAFSITVTAVDAYGNPATGYRGTVHFSSSDGAAALPGNYTFTGTDKGKHTFSVTLNTAGTQTITITDTAQSTITGTTTVAVQRRSPWRAPDYASGGGEEELQLAALDCLFEQAAVFPDGIIISGH
jgi:hypothetical protein